MHEDYAVDMVFSTSFYILIGGGLGLLIASVFFSNWWFWFNFAGMVLGLGVGIIKYKLRSYESFESFVIAVLPWFAIYSVYNSINTLSFSSLIHGIIIAALIYMYNFLDKKYKGFSWYKSGRVGFSGLTVAGVYFLLRGLFALFVFNVISFSLKFEPLISAVVSFTAFLLLFNLGRTKK